MEGNFTYKLDDTLYINLTNSCTNACTFCIRNGRDGLDGYDLWLERCPTAEEIIVEIPDPSVFPEIVFCGFGEPTMRLEVLKAVAKYIKNQGGITRLNTNGHGSLINKRDIVPELKGLIDTVSVSLNAGSKEEYDRVSVPQIDGAFEATVQFIKRSVEILPRTIATVVRVPGIDIEKARSLAEELGAEFRVRELEE